MTERAESQPSDSVAAIVLRAKNRWMDRAVVAEADVKRLQQRLAHLHDEVIPSYRAEIERLRSALETRVESRGGRGS